ncbi:FIG00554987: hypothetical protein [Cronobacter sakazakii 680]|nr:FIG00554987: hypothetical protein [Cronobacter sakazakii 680]
MNQFAQCRAMHQYYRDIFTRTIYLPEADVMPSHLVAEVLHFWSTDYAALEPAIMAAQTSLEEEKALAVKHLLCAATLANQAFDSKKQGHQIAAVEGFGDRVTAHVVEALKRDDAVNLVVAAIQLLFRVGEIDGAVFFNLESSLAAQQQRAGPENSAAHLPDGRRLQPGAGGDSGADGGLFLNRGRVTGAADDRLRHL